MRGRLRIDYQSRSRLVMAATMCFRRLPGILLPFLLVSLLAVESSTPQSRSSTPRSQPAGPGHEGRPVADSLGLEWLRWLAREDTSDIPKQYLYGRWVETRAQLPTLKEIIEWCIDGERNRARNVEDLSFVRRVRTGLYWGDPADTSARRVLIEEVAQIYVKPPDRFREVTLGERTWNSKEKKETIKSRVRVRDSAERLSDLPFFFRVLDDYRFEILERRILPDRVIYKIGFTRRSDFASLPEGWFLVDTRQYQILHAEMAWKKNVPFPLFLKSVDRLILSRKRYGDTWLSHRTIATLRLRSLPLLSTPKFAEVDVQREDVVLNAGLPDSVFTH